MSVSYTHLDVYKSQRFAFVNALVSQVEKRKVLTKDKGTGDAIDAVLTNKFLGIPIFAVVMFLVFQISQTLSLIHIYIAELEEERKRKLLRPLSPVIGVVSRF